jgi:hypothetical protein
LRSKLPWRYFGITTEEDNEPAELIESTPEAF